ncbi:MAG: hypothetical protein ACFCVD_18330 [Nodosilinea sp.]
MGVIVDAMKKQTLVQWLLVGGALGVGLPSVAWAETTSLELSPDTQAFANQTLTQGPIRVVARYEPIDSTAEPQQGNLQLQLFYDNELKLSIGETVHLFGSVDLNDLDSDGTPELVVQAFTGGAHCCMAITTYTWQDEAFTPIYFDYLDSGGGRFEDLDGDGLTEFITLDNAFFYAFSSYAGSAPPGLVLTFQDGRYVDTTQQFKGLTGEMAAALHEGIEAQTSVNSGEINGLLAGYVAQNIRLGQYQEAWDLMLSHYDQASDWGLEVYDSTGEVVEQYPDFPTALESFLTELGYLEPSGVPQPGVDRAPVVRQRLH